MNIIQQFVWLGMMSVPVAAMAQQTTQQNAEEPLPLYQVEVLIFKHLDQSRTSEEIPRLAEPELEDVLDQQLAQMSAQTETNESNRQETPREFSDVPANPAEPAAFWSALPEDKLSMNRDAARLQKLAAYDVLAHLAWVQPAPDVAVAEEIDVTELGARTDVQGSIKLYSKKYLHLWVDLALGEAYRDQGTGGPFAQLLPVNQARPSIADSRRMRLGRTVYFDQPKFGVLATVYKLEAADTEIPVAE